MLLEEADFIVQQMLFLGEEVFLNSTIYKALVRFKNHKRINQRRNFDFDFYSRNILVAPKSRETVSVEKV